MPIKSSEAFYCPTCKAVKRFEYKIHLDEWVGECGHRITLSDIKTGKPHGQ